CILYIIFMIFLNFFFFQAEDGIRDRNVTGVQTCALPISHHRWLGWGLQHVAGRPSQTDSAEGVRLRRLLQPGSALDCHPPRGRFRPRRLLDWSTESGRRAENQLYKRLCRIASPAAVDGWGVQAATLLHRWCR